jgi:hypothetical protein
MMWRVAFFLFVPVEEMVQAFKLAAWQCTSVVRLYQTAQGLAGFSMVNAMLHRHAQVQIVSGLSLLCAASPLSRIKQNDSMNTIFWCNAGPNHAVFPGGPTPTSTL